MARGGDLALRKLIAALETPPSVLDMYADQSQVDVQRERYCKHAACGVSLMAHYLVRAARTGDFQAVLVVGRQGAGKSIFSMRAAYSTLKVLGYDVEPSDIYREWMIFRFDDLLDKLEDGWRPVLIWDDAGIEAGAKVHFVSAKKAKAIEDVIKVIRTRLSSLVASTPHPRDVVRPLRAYEVIIVHVKRIDHFYSQADAYLTYLLPSGQVRTKKLFVEVFPRRWPGYEDYAAVRDSYVEHAIREYKRIVAMKELEAKLKRAKMLIQVARLVEKAQELGIEVPEDLRRLAEEARRGASQE